MRWGAGVVAAACLWHGDALAQDGAPSAPATPAQPPAPPPDHYSHDGFYLRFAIGPGHYDIWGIPGVQDLAGTAVSEFFAVGGTVPVGSGALVVGGALSSFLAFNPANAVGNYGALLDWFPSRGGGLHVGALLGVGLVRYPEPIWIVPMIKPGAVIVQQMGSHAGLGTSLLAGYDAWITPQCALGASILATTVAFVTEPGELTRPQAVTPLAVGILASVLYH